MICQISNPDNICLKFSVVIKTFMCCKNIASHLRGYDKIVWFSTSFAVEVAHHAHKALKHFI